MKILICPLNWGLGHATRCVPIIRQLLVEGHTPVIVSDGYPLEFLRLTFPQLRFIEYPSYSITYSSANSQIFAMLKNFPTIFFGIINEHHWLKEILTNEHFDTIISDNRFGMWSKKIKSVYISHQLMVKMPRFLKFMEPIVWMLHRSIINQYNECWIPDYPNSTNLSGDLSHKYALPLTAKFIGPLSRFSGIENIIPDKSYDVVVILSGIEPQRTIFENNLIKKYRNENYKTLIIRGKPESESKSYTVGNVTLISHLDDLKLAKILVGSRKIVSRSGYSTIMDLEALNCLKKAELIPTPGQTEQEYLYSIHV